MTLRIVKLKRKLNRQFNRWLDRGRWPATGEFWILILVCSFCFVAKPATAQKKVLPEQGTAIPSPVENGVAAQRKPFGIQVPSGGDRETGRAVSSPEALSAILQRTAAAHNTQQLSRVDMIAEGTVTVSTDNGPVALGVTLVRNGEHQSQRIVLQQADGKRWDGRGDHLSAEGRRALEFLETQFAHGLRQLLDSPARDAAMSDHGIQGTAHVISIQEKNGDATKYFLDAATSRIERFEFVRDLSGDLSGRSSAAVHAYAFADFRSTGGVAIPFRVEHDVDGVKQEELQFTKVQTSAPAQGVAVGR